MLRAERPWTRTAHRRPRRHWRRSARRCTPAAPGVKPGGIRCLSTNCVQSYTYIYIYTHYIDYIILIQYDIIQYLYIYIYICIYNIRVYIYTHICIVIWIIMFWKWNDKILQVIRSDYGVILFGLTISIISMEFKNLCRLCQGIWVGNLYI